MIELTQEELKQHFSEPIFGQISETADAAVMSVTFFCNVLLKI